MAAKEYIHNGVKYSVERIHSGQYQPYGDTHHVLRIRTDADRDSILQFLKDQFGYDCPSKEKWNWRTPNDYFAGYYILTSFGNVWRYDKCEPYTD